MRARKGFASLMVVFSVLVSAGACSVKVDREKSPTSSSETSSDQSSTGTTSSSSGSSTGETTGILKGRVSIDWPCNTGIGGADVYLEENPDRGDRAIDTWGDACVPEHGSYIIHGVQPGTYTVVAKHNEAGYVRKSGVVIQAGKTTVANLVYPP